MSRLVHWALLAAALGCGLNAGVTFAFSAFVMPALDRLAPAQSIAAMQSMNKLAPAPPFGPLVGATALACAGLLVWAVVSWGERAAPWIAAGAALFLLGWMLVTFAGNIPLNDALDSLDPQAADAAKQWRDYYGDWMPLNHLRTVAALAATGLLTVALRVS
jgi:uncharacterized membrane protein